MDQTDEEAAAISLEIDSLSSNEIFFDTVILPVEAALFSILFSSFSAFARTSTFTISSLSSLNAGDDLPKSGVADSQTLSEDSIPLTELLLLHSVDDLLAASSPDNESLEGLSSQEASHAVAGEVGGQKLFATAAETVVEAVEDEDDDIIKEVSVEDVENSNPEFNCCLEETETSRKVVDRGWRQAFASGDMGAPADDSLEDAVEDKAAATSQVLDTESESTGE